MKELILKYVLQNAIQFKGKANPGAIIGKLIAENPKIKKDMKEVSKKIQEIIKEVNSLSLEEQNKQLQEIAPELLEKKEKKETNIFSMFDIKENEKVVTAFPPEPSKYPHIGHAKALFLNYGLAKKYNGKFILRFEDTNPKLAEVEFYKINIENYEWLGIKADEITYASDYMEKFYELAEKMIEENHAYVCICDQENTKKNRMKGNECSCRSFNAEENIEKYKEMFKADEGNMVVRLKGDMNHSNSTMRDPTLLRIIKHKHARQGDKYSVWPTYDLENSVMDGLQGITHRLRTKEFELRNELQGYIQKILGFKQTKIDEFARFNLEGVESSGRVIRELIKEKKLIGWDDPSLTTIVALRRRGFVPEAIKNFVLSTGITKSESTLTWDDLIVHNKRILDAKVNRYFFIKDAKEIEIENAPEQDVKLKLHPDFEERGYREFKVKDKFYIEKGDFEKFEDGKVYRLIDCLNFRKEGNKLIFDSVEHEKYKKEGHLIIHWLPKEKLVDVEVLMPDKEVAIGIAEPMAMKLEENDVVQFQRFGFCRLDKKEKNKLSFWYTHK